MVEVYGENYWDSGANSDHRCWKKIPGYKEIMDKRLEIANDKYLTIAKLLKGYKLKYSVRNGKRDFTYLTIMPIKSKEQN